MELEWEDFLKFKTPPLEGATVYYMTDDQSYVGKGYFLNGQWFSTPEHELVRSVRWWAYPTKAVPIYSGPTMQQYSVAWGLLQDIIASI